MVMSYEEIFLNFQIMIQNFADTDLSVICILNEKCLVVRAYAKKKQENSSWGKKKQSKTSEEKKGKFDWLKNIFKKSEKEKNN